MIKMMKIGPKREREREKEGEAVKEYEKLSNAFTMIHERRTESRLEPKDWLRHA